MDPQHVSLVQLRPLVLNSLKVKTQSITTININFRSYQSLQKCCQNHTRCLRSTMSFIKAALLMPCLYHLPSIMVPGGAERCVSARSFWVPAKTRSGREEGTLLKIGSNI